MRCFGFRKAFVSTKNVHLTGCKKDIALTTKGVRAARDVVL